ncbi:MAG: type II toxin-antitoxin system VapB family antitoxin [Nocardioides sp.]
MNIKDPRIHAAAQELARRRGVSMTEAVRQAVDEALAAERAKRERLAERILEIGRRARATADAEGVVFLTDDDLYDENGLPR